MHWTEDLVRSHPSSYKFIGKKSFIMISISPSGHNSFPNWCSSTLPGLTTSSEELSEQNNLLSKRLEEFKGKEKAEERKQIEFSEKIDELNQETDNLLDEIDKWQM